MTQLSPANWFGRDDEIHHRTEHANQIGPRYVPPGSRVGQNSSEKDILISYRNHNGDQQPGGAENRDGNALQIFRNFLVEILKEKTNQNNQITKASQK